MWYAADEEKYPRIDADILVSNLMVLRKKYALSQTALGRLTGCSVVYIRALERGREYLTPSREVLNRMAQIFQVTYEELTQTYLEIPEEEQT